MKPNSNLLKLYGVDRRTVEAFLLALRTLNVGDEFRSATTCIKRVSADGYSLTTNREDHFDTADPRNILFQETPHTT